MSRDTKPASPHSLTQDHLFWKRTWVGGEAVTAVLVTDRQSEKGAGWSAEEVPLSLRGETQPM